MYSQPNPVPPVVFPLEMSHPLPLPGSRGTPPSRRGPAGLLLTLSHSLPPGTTDMRTSARWSALGDSNPDHSLGALQLLAPSHTSAWPSCWHPDHHSLQLLAPGTRRGPIYLQSHSRCWHLTRFIPVCPVTVTQACGLSNAWLG